VIHEAQEGRDLAERAPTLSQAAASASIRLCWNQLPHADAQRLVRIPQSRTRSHLLIAT
jgi:hypothetical protein